MNIKETYLKIYNDETLNEIYDKVNKKINYVIDHGKLHVQHVLNYIVDICEILNIDERTKYLTLIAGALHDVGRLKSKKYHSVYSTNFARSYLADKTVPLYIDIICEAIKMHDSDYFDPKTANDSAWILILADKLDYTRSRYRNELVDDIAKAKFSYNIEKFDLTKQDNKIILTITSYHNIDKSESKFKRNMDLYNKVFAHFNKKLEVKFVIKNN